MKAGLETLDKISKDGFYEDINVKTQKLVNGQNDAAEEAGLACKAISLGSMFGLFFTDKNEITCFEDVQSCDKEMFNKFFGFMLDKGVYFAPSAFEAGFMSIEHSDCDIEDTIKFAKKFFEGKDSSN